VDGDHRGGARFVLAPDHLQQPALLGAVAFAGGAHLGQDQIAVAQAGGVRPGQHQPVTALAIDRLDPGLAAALAHDAEQAMRALPKALDQPGLGLAAFQALEAHQQPVAHARRAGGGLAAIGG
jgi:hypothetical protein